VLFVCVASLAVWRRSVGIGNARAIRALDARRVQLEGERAAVQSRIREAASRGRIGAVAEQRLGMRVPADTQVIIVPARAPRRPRRPPPRPDPARPPCPASTAPRSSTPASPRSPSPSW
jgi:hypothetical protein